MLWASLSLCWECTYFPAIDPKSIPRADAITMDGNVLGFRCWVSLFTGVLFGIAPALFATKVGLSEALAERSEGAASRRWRNLRSLLVVSEVALALILLISAGLLIRSLQRIHNVQLGNQQRDNMLTMEISLPGQSIRMAASSVLLRRRSFSASPACRRWNPQAPAPCFQVWGRT